MALPIGTRNIPYVADRDPKKQQFFEEVKFRLDNLTTPPPTEPPTAAPGTITQALTLVGRGITAEPINAYQAVTTNSLGDIIKADAGTLHHGDQVLGIALTSQSAGLEVEYAQAGDVTNGGWSWTPGNPIFLGLAGNLTENPNVGVFMLQIGYAKTSTVLAVDIKFAIYR